MDTEGRGLFGYICSGFTSFLVASGCCESVGGKVSHATPYGMLLSRLDGHILGDLSPGLVMFRASTTSSEKALYGWEFHNSLWLLKSLHQKQWFWHPPRRV